MGFIYSVVGFLIAISVLVAVHEFGHFWVARKLGVKVLKFSIGFGKPLWRKVHGEDQIEYVIAAIPLGGYVKMLGEDDPDSPVDPKERHRAFDNQPIWKRSLIVLAGPGINFLFAILLFLMLGMMSKEALVPNLGEPPADSIIAKAGITVDDKLLEVDGKGVEYFGQHDLYIFNRVLQGKDINLTFQQSTGSVVTIEVPVADIPIYNINPTVIARSIGLMPTFPNVSTVLNRIIKDSPAAIGGLQIDDEIIAVDDVAISSWADLVDKISAAPSNELQLTIVRDQAQQIISVTPEAKEINGQVVGRIGIGPKVLPYSPEQQVVVDRSIGQALSYGVEQTWLMSCVTMRMLWKMVTLQVSSKNISGPITIAEVTGQAIQIGLDYYLFILAVISISLGVMNLLPIPMLDGGHLLMYVVEIGAGKDISHKVFAVGQRVGVFLLICLMSLAFYNDIFRLLN